MPSKPNPRVFMDIEIDGEPKGRMVFELYADVVPLTAENFRQLCTGEHDREMCFRNSYFHRVIPGFMAQGGDYTRGNGTGGKAIYPGGKFKDESFKGKAGKHTGFGCLSMANSGPNTNGSQFFICTAETPWLDGHHVVFGQLVEGEATLKCIEAHGSSPTGKPKKPIKIANCGSFDDVC